MGAKQPTIPRVYSNKFFPKIADQNLLLNILSYLLPHELYQISYLNSYIYQTIHDPLVWIHLTSTSYPRLSAYSRLTNQITFYYPTHITHPSHSAPSSNIIRLPPLKENVPIHSLIVETDFHRIFIIGGQIYSQEKSYITAEVYEFNESKLRLVKKLRMTYPRMSMKSVTFPNEIYVIGGVDNGLELKYVEKYSLENEKWYTVIDMPFTIQTGVAIRSDNSIYCIPHLRTSQFKIANYQIS